MAKKKIVNLTEEAKQDIAIVEENEKEAVTDGVQSKTDLCATGNKEVCTCNSEAVCETRKPGKIKGFLKKHWKKILISFGIAVASGAVGYVVGKKTNELSDEDIHNIEQEGIKDYWRRIALLFKDDSDQAYAVSVGNKETGIKEWFEVTPVDSIPEWVKEKDNAETEF